MIQSDLFFGSASLKKEKREISLNTVVLNEETFFKIENYDHMDPFFMTIVSDVDHWMFISSTGGLTCGRQNAESALFPYYTDDKIHDSFENTGSNTLFIVLKDEQNFFWKPFSLHHSNVYHITRSLYKNTLGNQIVFEEVNHDLELRFIYTWKNSAKYGFVKQSEVFNMSAQPVSLKVLDGIRNILPYGVNTQLQTTSSTLVDGYKRCELVLNAGLGIFTLSSILSDRAEPSESLKSTTVWSKGLENPTYLLSEIQVDAFALNEKIETEYDIKGRRGSFYVSSKINLDVESSKSWVIVSELNQSASKVISLIADIQNNDSLLEEIRIDILQGSANLRRLVFNADGLQCTANEKAIYRHFSNTMFNIMRGGVYLDGYNVPSQDFKAFVTTWNKPVAIQHEVFLNQLPESIDANALLKLAQNENCKDLERLVLEYLPLTFSRRHGDPSRPWNRFSIEVLKEDGSKKLNFEGNWRDIFQNWEALSISYPAFIDNIIAKFVNASTADGYNPYRITKNGFDWEDLNPAEPWSNIGYWGDHQIIYLLKLMELSQAYNPKQLHQLLFNDIFVYANVPYKIKGFDALVADPRNTIDYDYSLEERIHKRVSQIGADGKLLTTNGDIYRVNLLEKLLVTLLSKLSNYVPEGGIWMNTQRPEWNDANNALVGNGLSMVTLYYLHRFQDFMRKLMNELDVDHVSLSNEVATMFHETHQVFKDAEKLLHHPISDADRFDVVKSLGVIGENYRNHVYESGFSGEKTDVSIESFKAFIDITMKHLKDSIHKNKREDGLYHAYNLIRFDNKGCSISYLYEMLEGQVSVLSSKALSAEESISVLRAMRASSMYREDQNSYMLYPNRELPKFLDKNIIPEHLVMSSRILREEVAHNRVRFIEKDALGHYHFNGRFRNGNDIAHALKATRQFSDEDIKVVHDIFYDLFNHHAFTGRSGTFYKYEGLGSIYWHMVSKLVLATQENFEDLVATKGYVCETQELALTYKALKDGIGVDKSPKVYGAFPTDAYSHTPSFSGVQQPGLTGQVKEDFITRMSELGVKVKDGQVSFTPLLLERTEFLSQSQLWSIPSRNTSDVDQQITLEKDTLGFTFCSVPIVYQLAEVNHISVRYFDGTVTHFEGQSLDDQTSQRLFARDGSIQCIHVQLTSKALR